MLFAHVSVWGVVVRLTRCSLRVFSFIHGMGVFTTVRLPANNMVLEYRGTHDASLAC